MFCCIIISVKVQYNEIKKDKKKIAAVGIEPEPSDRKSVRLTHYTTRVGLLELGLIAYLWRFVNEHNMALSAHAQNLGKGKK